jgi:hypothetical protein
VGPYLALTACYAEWHASAAYTLAGLARLKDLERKHDGGRGYASLVALIEKYENDFGLTPKGRQALRWKVEDEETIETLRNDELETQRNVRRLRAVDPDLEGANE